MAEYDRKVLVIGAGVGGLAAAIRLAIAGNDVTLLEAAQGPGGKMRTVASDAGPVDAGPTVLTLRRVFDDLFELAGERLDERLTMLPQPVLARHWWPDASRLDLFSDPASSAAAISDFACPSEAAGFLRFHAVTATLYDAFDRPMMRASRPKAAAVMLAAVQSPDVWPALIPGVSLDRFIGGFFRDPRLRQLFGRYATYVGGRPAFSPAVLSLIWQAEARGVWAVKGGMHNLALALASLAERVGVTLQFGTSVNQIICQRGVTKGVRLADGKTVACNQIVFNGDPAALTNGLLGTDLLHCVTRQATEPRSLSAQVWSFATELSGAIAKDLVHHNVFFSSDPTLEFGPIGAGRLPIEPTIYLCAQDRAANVCPQGKERIEIVLNAPAIAAGTNPDPEETLQCRIKTLALLKRAGLIVKTSPTDNALTTPHNLNQMFPGSRGAIYGRSPEGQMASFQRPTARTAIHGLYLAGGGCHPGAGVPMAALSGLHAAEAIANDQISASRSSRTDTRGGMSMVSRMMARARSRS